MKDSDVAKATGITKSTFSDWKNGRSNPKDAKAPEGEIWVDDAAPKADGAAAPVAVAKDSTQVK
mgnify:CR=1 FL=1